MPHIRAEDLQRKLLQKKTNESVKKVVGASQALVGSTSTSIPVRKATARKSTHTSRNSDVNKSPKNGTIKTIKVTTNGVNNASSNTIDTNKLNGILKPSISKEIDNKQSKQSCVVNTKEKISNNNSSVRKSTGKVELIKETVQGIKGSLGLFLKAKKRTVSPSNKKQSWKKVQTNEDSVGQSKNKNSELINDLYEDVISDDSLPENISPPPENESVTIRSDSQTTATTSEDAGSEEGLKLWLDESSLDTDVSSDDNEFVSPSLSNCQSAAIYNDGGAESSEDVKVVAAVTLQRLPTGVIHKLSSAGRIKVQLKRARRLQANGENDDEMRPEVSVIDGIEFYSFETEEDLIEYTIQDQKLKLASDDNDTDVCAYAQPIIPTKTNDITQIKGWRSKIFAAETTNDAAASLAEITNFDWMKKLKNSTESLSSSVNVKSNVNYTEELEKAKENVVVDNNELEDEVSEEVEEEDDQEDEEDEENKVIESSDKIINADLPLKTYGASRSKEDICRFNEMYLGSKKMMAAVSKPLKTKYGWFQQFGNVKVPVGSTTDSAPTFLPSQPTFRYDSKAVKAILSKNKKKEPEELSLQERGLITPNWAYFAVGAVKIDAEPDLQPIKTVIKIDETKRYTGKEVNKPKPLTNLNGKSILKKNNNLNNISNNNNNNKNKKEEINLNQQNMIDILAKRGVEVSVKVNATVNRQKNDGQRLSESFSEISSRKITKPPADYVEITEPPRCDDSISNKDKPECGQFFCKFGCVCDSIKVRKRKRTHCGNVDCMFNCDCGFTITSKTTGMMNKILSPSIQSCDRGENFNTAIQTDEGPVKRRRVSRPPARLMDSDFICKSAKDLLILPEHLREKMHYEKRVYTKFEKRVYNKSPSIRGRRIGVNNGARSPRDDQQQSKQIEQQPRVPPIRIVNLKGNSYPKVSPVSTREMVKHLNKARADKAANQSGFLKKRKIEIGKSQHVLPCGTIIVEGKVSLTIPTETNARALLQMGENDNGQSSLKFIGLRLNNGSDVMHCTEKTQYLTKNITSDVKAKDDGEQKHDAIGNESIFETLYAKVCDQQSVKKIIGYVIANDVLKDAVSLAKRINSPVSAPVSFTVAEFVRTDANKLNNILPSFNIYPITDSSTHVFVGPFDRILSKIFRDSVLKSAGNGNGKKDVKKEVEDVVNALLDCVCQVMEPQKYAKSTNLNYKVAERSDAGYKRFTISGNQIIRKKTLGEIYNPGFSNLKSSKNDANWKDAKGKKGIHPKYLPADVVNLAYKRKLELKLEREINKNTEIHRDRERNRRKKEIKQLERLNSLLDPTAHPQFNAKYPNKPNLLSSAKKMIQQLEVDIATKERVKGALITKRCNLFNHYRNKISGLPEERRSVELKKLTDNLQACCQTRAEEREKLQSSWNSSISPKRNNGKNKVPSISSESSSSSEESSGTSTTSSSQSEENSNGDNKLLNKNSNVREQEMDLVMSVEEENSAGNSETPGLLMYAEVDDDDEEEDDDDDDEEVPQTKTQEKHIESTVESTKTTATNSNNSIALRLNTVSTISKRQNVVLQFNDAAALTSLLNNQTIQSPVTLITNQNNVVNQSDTNIELPKIVGCATISEAEFWADS